MLLFVVITGSRVDILIETFELGTGGGGVGMC